MLFYLVLLVSKAQSNAPQVSALVATSANEQLRAQPSIRACPENNLYSLRACEAKSNCTWISTNSDGGSSALIKKEGWCAPSSDALQVGK